MDRFEESQPIGLLTSECWGGDNVKPRDDRQIAGNVPSVSRKFNEVSKSLK